MLRRQVGGAYPETVVHAAHVVKSLEVSILDDALRLDFLDQWLQVFLEEEVPLERP